jgi:hypothetical protein
MDFEREGFLGVEADWLMGQTLQTYSAWFSLAFDINRFVNKHKQLLPITFEQPKEIVLMTLYTKISNHYQATIILLQKGLSVECDILVRSILESLIPLKLIVTDENFFAEFVRNDKASNYRLYNIMLDKQNSDVFTLSDDDLRKREELKEELTSAFKSGEIRTFSAEELARRAHMNMDYQLAYRYLSGYVHSSLEALSKAYLIIEEGELQAFNLGHYVAPYKRILFSAMYFSLQAFEHMENHFGTGLLDEMGKYVQSLQGLRAQDEE